jgi:hypothetical protein
MKKIINLFHYVSLVILALLSVVILFNPNLNIWQKIGLYIGLTLVNDLINFKTMVKIVDHFTGRDSLSELKIILGQKRVEAPGPRITSYFDVVTGSDGHIRLMDKPEFRPMTPEELVKKIESMREQE